MNKILQVRKSVWVAICIWLGFARGYDLQVRAEVVVPEIHNSFALDVFNIPLTRDSLLRIFGRSTNGISGYSTVLQHVDQPTGAFVESLLHFAIPPAAAAAGGSTNSCNAGPTPPPLPPVTTLPTETPVPVSCTQITENEVCHGIIFSSYTLVHCAVNVCCLKGGAANHCAVVSSWSYTTTTGFGE
jgi:hypothetical protein